MTDKYYDETKMRTWQKQRVKTDTLKSLGCRTTPPEHWIKRKPTVDAWWAKQQTKQLRPQRTQINSIMSGPSLSLTPDPPACKQRETFWPFAGKELSVAFSYYCSYLMPSKLYVFLSHFVLGQDVEFDCTCIDYWSLLLIYSTENCVLWPIWVELFNQKSIKISND